MTVATGTQLSLITSPTDKQGGPLSSPAPGPRGACYTMAQGCLPHRVSLLTGASLGQGRGATHLASCKDPREWTQVWATPARDGR